MSGKAIFVKDKEETTLSVDLLPVRNRIVLEDANSDTPDTMIIEAMLQNEVIKSYDDGNGGMLKYMEKVCAVVKRLKHDGIQTVFKAIEGQPNKYPS